MTKCPPYERCLSRSRSVCKLNCKLLAASWYASCSVYCVFNCHVVFVLYQNSWASRRHRSTSHQSRKKKPEKDIWKSCIVWVWQSKNTSMFQIFMLWVEGNDLFPFHFISTLRNWNRLEISVQSDGIVFSRIQYMIYGTCSPKARTVHNVEERWRKDCRWRGRLLPSRRPL